MNTARDEMLYICLHERVPRALILVPVSQFLFEPEKKKVSNDIFENTFNLGKHIIRNIIYNVGIYIN